VTTLRLLADDLTGALDTAAELVPLTGPVQVRWHGAAAPGALPANAALDTGTRERDEAAARLAVMRATPALAGADIAFKKIDSLMRGQTLAELAACFAAGGWRRGVLAPAFPFQGRVTRAGRQFAAAGEAWRAVGPDLAVALRGLGVPARHFAGEAVLEPGITVFDAETEADLRAIVARAGGVGAPVLWSGTGGLAQALAAAAPPVTPPVAPPGLPRPVLGLFGSDQPATAAQLAACGPHWVRLPQAGDHAAALRRGLEGAGIALASHDLPPGLGRAEAARRIEQGFAGLLGGLPVPGTLLAAGGETLRGLCLALGAEALEVRARIVPGVPVSVLRGGAWDGVTVVSKSGAFGHPALLREMLDLPEFERSVA
jgi:D-threonate/D-erythronate kinase